MGNEAGQAGWINISTSNADLHGKTENHVLKLEFKTPGIEAFTFTFG